jgi:hypothetical protein
MSAAHDPPAADLQALVDAIADALVDRGLIASPSTSAIRVVSASQLAELLHRDRRWVYEHAHELGGFRYGDGPKARLGFDLAAVQEWKQRRRDAFARSARARPKSTQGGLMSARPSALIRFED